MIVKPATPTFEAIQWTGSNQSACEDFIDARSYESVTYSRIEEPPDNVNTLRCTGTAYFNLFVPLDCYAMYGPIFGEDLSQASLDFKTADQLANQYEEVV